MTVLKAYYSPYWMARLHSNGGLYSKWVRGHPNHCTVQFTTVKFTFTGCPGSWDSMCIVLPDGSQEVALLRSVFMASEASTVEIEYRSEYDPDNSTRFEFWRP